uniref:Uncharacterized protein n=1 Tax=Physcomitrium patens TaxID=3218 RepID=A0A2K1KVL0_PHYPA|nr:hypothetical protein PHYPA_004826 [Physcomitrium patens]
MIFFTNKFNTMTIDKRGNINMYLINTMDMQNQLKAFRKTILDKILKNLVFNRLLQSYKLVI